MLRQALYVDAGYILLCAITDAIYESIISDHRQMDQASVTYWYTTSGSYHSMVNYNMIVPADVCAYKLIHI